MRTMISFDLHGQIQSGCGALDHWQVNCAGMIQGLGNAGVSKME
jgi:hypothetical protein